MCVFLLTLSGTLPGVLSGTTTSAATAGGTTGSALPGVESLQRIREAALAYARLHFEGTPGGGTQNRAGSGSVESGSRLRLEVTGLDERLKLAACDGPLKASSGGLAARGGRMTVLVRCGGTQPWKVYVRLSVREYRDIVVATRALGRGEIVAEADVQRAEREVSRLHRPYSERPESIIGRTLRRSVRAGEAIALDALEQRLLVENGERVTLVSGSEGYSISMAGVALNDAAEGDRVSVRNLSSGRLVQGRAIDRGLVRVGPGG